MNNNYCLSGTKIVIRRLFKQDTADILSCYEEYNTLFHNPVSAEYLENIFLCGEIWGAYLGGSIIGCCYYFPMDSGFFRNTAFGSALADFTDCTGKYYFMGYVGIKHENISCGSNCSNVPTESGLYMIVALVLCVHNLDKQFQFIQPELREKSVVYTTITPYAEQAWEEIKAQVETQKVTDKEDSES